MERSCHSRPLPGSRRGAAGYCVAEMSDRVGGFDHEAARWPGRTVGGFIQDVSFRLDGTLGRFYSAQWHIESACQAARAGVGLRQHPSSGQAATATRFRRIIPGGRGVAARSARTGGAVLYAQRAGSDRLFESSRPRPWRDRTSAHVGQYARYGSARRAGLKPIKHAAGSAPLTSGCDGDGQKLRWPDLLRDGLAVGSKT